MHKRSGQFDYTLRVNPRAKRVILKVSGDRGLEVVVPKGFDKRRVPEVLERRRQWIDKHYARLLNAGMRPGECAELPDTVELAAEGVRYRVGVIEKPGKAALSVNSEDRLVLRCSNPQEGVTLLRQWLKNRAKSVLPPLLKRESLKIGLRFERTQVRLQRSRWASCSARGTVSLNARLMFLPPEIVRYVFVHELCHTKHMDHSPAYWSTVERIVPEYKIFERRLKEEGRRLVPSWAA